jgi:phage terminase Nu1 subunit (DNA packaging protein)
MTDIALPNCSATDLANITGITKQRIYQLVDQGVIKKSERGVFNLAESVRRYCEYIRGVSRGSDTKKEGDTYRNKLVKAKADMAAMEAAKMRGDLISASVQRSHDHTLATILKNNLFSIPDRVSSIIAAESNAGVVHDLITSGVRNSLNNVVKSMEETEVDDASLDITRNESNKHLNRENKNG